MRNRLQLDILRPLAGLAAAVALAGCQPQPPAQPPAPEPPAASPAPESPAAGADVEVLLKKDPDVPLIIVAEETDGLWCPKSVTGAINSDCPADKNGHKACRQARDPVRWMVLNAAKLEVVAADFRIRFMNPNAPFERRAPGPDKSCGASDPGEGTLDCKVKDGAQVGDYKYEIIMSGGEGCKLDPTITVNPRNTDPVPGGEAEDHAEGAAD